MIALKTVALATILAAPMLLAGSPAEAFTARQASSQGQGIFVTSIGMPQNFIPSEAVARQGDDSNQRPLRTHNHNRYFAGF